jgi:hypothetical protein
MIHHTVTPYILIHPLLMCACPRSTHDRNRNRNYVTLLQRPQYCATRTVEKGSVPGRENFLGLEKQDTCAGKAKAGGYQPMAGLGLSDQNRAHAQATVQRGWLRSPFNTPMIVCACSTAGSIRRWSSAQGIKIWLKHTKMIFFRDTVAPFKPTTWGGFCRETASTSKVTAVFRRPRNYHIFRIGDLYCVRPAEHGDPVMRSMVTL